MPKIRLDRIEKAALSVCTVVICIMVGLSFYFVEDDNLIVEEPAMSQETINKLSKDLDHLDSELAAIRAQMLKNVESLKQINEGLDKNE